MEAELIKISKYLLVTLFDLFDLKMTLKFKIERGIHPNLLPNDIKHRFIMDACY